MASMLALKKITKRYGDVFANREISLSIDEGEVYCLLGENGAGKSTLMNVLYGLTRPDHAYIEPESVLVYTDDSTGTVVVRSCSQQGHAPREFVADALRIPMAGSLGPDGRVATFRVCPGGAFPRPRCFPEEENPLIGQLPEQARFAEIAGEIARALGEEEQTLADYGYKSRVLPEIIHGVCRRRFCPGHRERFRGGDLCGWRRPRGVL